MISIVIPAYNEEKNIARCLDAFLHQTTTRPFEVILVNNASTDRTVAIAESYVGKLTLTIINDSVKGRGHARSFGFARARGDIILSSDSDAVVPEDWIERLASALEAHPEVVAVTGTCMIDDCDEKTNRRFNRTQPWMMKGYRVLFGHYWLSGFSFGIRKEAYAASGGFDPDLNAQEDIDLSAKVARIGKILFIPDVPVLFSGRRFKGGLLKGLVPYVRSFMHWYREKKGHSHLEDVR